MRTRVGPFRRAALVGALVTGLVFALGATALAAQVPVLPSTITPTVMAVAQTGPVAVPVQGANRVATAIEASKLFGSADTVVLATGKDFPDALGGSALAGAVDGPILLTLGATIEPAVLAEIDRLGATDVYILGGTGVVPAAVETALKGEGLNVTRLAGANRYATAKLVADKTISLLGGGYAGGAFAATGLDYADALAAAPVMYAKGMPLVLVDGAGSFTLSAGMTKVDILGGTGAVPASVQTALGAKFGTRVAGAGRYETAVAVATYGVGKGMSWNNLGIATGEGFADALCAGPLLGSKNSVMLMTQGTTLTSATKTKLEALKGDVDTYYVFGGTAVIAAPVRSSIQAALTPAAPEPEPVGAHALPDVFCTGAGCHDSDLAMIHVNLAGGKIGCNYCHGIAGGPKSDCESCHTDAHAGTHPEVASESAEACTQSGCHADGVVAIHADCTSCHNATTDVTDATCETCHEATEVQHAAVPAHTVVDSGGGCFDALCHGTDVTKMHGNDFRGSGEEPPGCAACHAEGVTPSVTCLGACHSSANFGAWHNSDEGHMYVEDTIAANSQGCVSCHGSDLLAVAPGEHAGCSCHAYFHAAGATACESCHADPMDPDASHPYHVGAHDAFEATVAGDESGACVDCHTSDLLGVGGIDLHVKDAHAGCVCHHYDDLIDDGFPLIGAKTTEAGECIDCHSGAFAPHGFATEPSVHHSESWVAASGHNTTAFGTIGAVEDFSDLLVGTDGNPVTPAWPFPTVNVFWEDGDTDASAGAMVLQADSVVTCEDCHTGFELAGPHGADDNWGIDPAYSADFAYAELTKNVVEYPSGIKIRTNLTTQTAYEDGSTMTICSKCHDLQNYGSGTTSGTPLPEISTGSAAYYHEGYETTFTPYYTTITRNTGWSVFLDAAGDPADAADALANDSTLNSGYTVFTQSATGTVNAAAIGSSNTAHSSHHQDTKDGSAQCVNCHIAVPHGWKAPRLLVNTGWAGGTNGIHAGNIEGDRAPYRSPYVLGTNATEGSGMLLDPATGYNGMGALTWPAAGPMRLTDGAAVWDRYSCEGCGHHYHAVLERNVVNGAAEGDPLNVRIITNTSDYMDDYVAPSGD